MRPNFREHKHRLIEGEDYIVASSDDIRRNNPMTTATAPPKKHKASSANCQPLPETRSAPTEQTS